MINKIDRGILEQQVDAETMYQKYLRILENINVIIATYESEEMGETLQVDPVKGTVAFGSALFGWAFSVGKFARIYSKKMGVDNDKMMEKLWGDNYFDKATGKYKKHNKGDDGSNLNRTFVVYIMDPIIRLCKATMANDMDKVDKFIGKLGIELKKEERAL